MYILYYHACDYDSSTELEILSCSKDFDKLVQEKEKYNREYLEWAKESKTQHDEDYKKILNSQQNRYEFLKDKKD